MEITKQIKDKIKDLFFMDESGKWNISLGNFALDFKKTYFFDKFTDKGIKIYTLDSGKRINYLAKIEKRHNYYVLYTENFQFIEHFIINGSKQEVLLW